MASDQTNNGTSTTSFSSASPAFPTAAVTTKLASGSVKSVDNEGERYLRHIRRNKSPVASETSRSARCDAAASVTMLVKYDGSGSVRSTPRRGSAGEDLGGVCHPCRRLRQVKGGRRANQVDRSCQYQIQFSRAPVGDITCQVRIMKQDVSTNLK